MRTPEIPQGRILNRENALKRQKGGEPRLATIIRVMLTQQSRMQELRVGMAIVDVDPSKENLDNLRRIVERQKREP